MRFVHKVYACPFIVYVYQPCELSFFFNQPTKYRHQSGARRSTTVRTIAVIIVLYHSSYPLEHPLFSLSPSYSSFGDGLIILDLYVCCSLFSIYKQQLTPLGHLFFLLLLLLFFLVAHSHVKIQLMNILICKNTHRVSKDNIIEKQLTVNPRDR